jgi:hypothetical protein
MRRDERNSDGSGLLPSTQTPRKASLQRLYLSLPRYLRIDSTEIRVPVRNYSHWHNLSARQYAKISTIRASWGHDQACYNLKSLYCFCADHEKSPFASSLRHPPPPTAMSGDLNPPFSLNLSESSVAQPNGYHPKLLRLSMFRLMFACASSRSGIIVEQ